jgi:hypothetical protein
MSGNGCSYLGQVETTARAGSPTRPLREAVSCRQQAWTCPWRAGIYRRKRGDGAKRSHASPHLRCNDPSRKQIKQSHQARTKQASGSGPLVSVPRYRPVVRPSDQAAGAASTPRQTAHRLRRLRPARVGKAGPRPSQAPTGPRRPQPSLAPSQASGVDAAPAAWSEGLTTGRYRGTDTSPGQALSNTALRAVFSQHSSTRGLSEEQTMSKAGSQQ